MSILIKLSQRATQDMIDALASITSKHKTMVADSWTIGTDVSDNNLTVDFTVEVPYAVRTFRVGGAWSAETTSDNVESPYVSDCEISADPLTNARGKAANAITNIVKMFYFEPNDEMTRHQISQLIFDHIKLQTRWTTTPDGFSQLIVLGGETFPNTTWYMKV